MTPSFALLTDLYQITMAQGYWKLGKHQQPAVFDLFFRELPFQGGYAIACGLELVIKLIENYSFSNEDIKYLASLKAADKTLLFQRDFLDVLSKLRLSVNILGLKEGTLVFPREPLLRVEGPLWECQLLETTLLNLINFSTLIATKASRVCYAASGDAVVEFGLRRAQGPNGGLMASRSAFVGGVSGTSNVLAGELYGIPVSGTHAHSWVMAFESEIQAFEAYANTMPNNCILLVDTYNTLQGVKNAIQVGLKLKEKGSALLGIRLDSGDLATLSIEARQMLDAADLKDTVIVGSSDLDEYTISDLKKRGAKVSLWGVGTRLVTAYDHPALGGVYKLMAIESEKNKGQWIYKSKQTDDPGKKTISGVHKLRRFTKDNYFVRDVLYNEKEGEAPLAAPGESLEELLIPIIKEGKAVYSTSSLQEIQKHTFLQLQKLPEKYKLLKPEAVYPVLLQGIQESQEGQGIDQGIK